MKQKITGFEQDDEHHWRAILACGHRQHVRHDPPLTTRPWVLTEAGRASHLGLELNCKRCDEDGPGRHQMIVGAALCGRPFVKNIDASVGRPQRAAPTIGTSSMNDIRRNPLFRVAADLFPGYFALVMATGIISIACFLLAMKTISLVLLIVNVVAYVILCVLLLLRLLFFFSRVKADIEDHVRGPGFFTVVAGTCVLGSALLIVLDQYRPALVLWIAGLSLWAVIMYTFFTAVTVRENKPSIEAGLNGGWLLAVVSTQSISVLGTLLVSHLVDYREPILFFTFCMFLLGCMLYLPLITLIFYRFTFVNVTLASLTPPYWINMGAVAITTLAGARLIIAAPAWSLLDEVVPFLKGFTLFFWAAATWWIPLLLALGFWRHVYKRFPLKYDPQYWGMVFPFGMYTVCTFQLANAIGFPRLMVIPRYFIYLALAGWLAASLGLIANLVRGLASKSQN